MYVVPINDDIPLPSLPCTLQNNGVSVLLRNWWPHSLCISSIAELSGALLDVDGSKKGFENEERTHTSENKIGSVILVRRKSSLDGSGDLILETTRTKEQ